MKLDRLLGILTVLLQSNRVTAPELAQKFEVNRRTIGRDVDALCRAGIPIVTYQGVGGGISIADGYKLDKSVLTKDELSGIIAALKGIGSVTDEPWIERALDKLHASGDTVVSMAEPIIIDLASYYKGQLTEKIEKIKRAIFERQVVEFDYFYEKGESSRRIQPYFIAFQWSSWYVFGFCLTRQDWRMFKLNRLWNLNLSEESYTPREIPPERREMGSHFTDNIKLEALFDPCVKYRLIEAYGPDSYTETENGLLFYFDFTNRDFLISWLLGFGGNVQVIAPCDIVEGLKAAAKDILGRY